MTKNEKQLLESIVNFDANIKKAQLYIKEQYGVDSKFDLDTCTLHLSNGNDMMSLAAAKEYISENCDDLISCIYS